VNRNLEQSKVKTVSYVGSKPVVEYVYKRGSENLKRVQELTGAKNHSTDLADADLDLATKEVISAAFGSAGERCMACAVVTVEDSVADEFIAKLKAAADDIKMGNGLDDGVFLGPIIREDAKQ